MQPGTPDSAVKDLTGASKWVVVSVDFYDGVNRRVLVVVDERLRVFVVNRV